MNLRTKDMNPPGHFRFKHPVSGHEEAFHSWGRLRSWVTEHCEGNGYPPVSDAEIERQICERMGPKVAQRWCEGDGITVTGVRLGWYEIWNGTKVLASHILAGRPRVSAEEAERRAAICAPCERNVRFVNPCSGGCPELMEAVSSIVGAETTSRDSELLACSVCKCSNKAQVWVEAGSLEKGVDEAMLLLFPGATEVWPGCWKAAAIRELRSK